jgi:transcription initiation factor TFIID TATA-box-binding protein
MIVTGARSEKDSRIAAEHCINVIKDAGCQVNSGNSYRIQNICATTHLGYRVRIHEMGPNKEVKGWGKIFNYSPEIFAGLVCNFEVPKVTVVCFATGTLLFSGAHREEDIQMALYRFQSLAFPFRY